MSMQLWSYLSGSAPGLVLSAGYVAVFVYGGHRVIAGTLTLGTFIAFMAYYMRLFQPVQALMGLYANIATVEVSLARVHQLLDTPPDVVEAADPIRLATSAAPSSSSGVSVDLGRGQVLRVGLVQASRRARPWRSSDRAASASRRSPTSLVRLLDPDAGTRQAGRHRSAGALALPICGGTSCWSTRIPSSSTPPSPRTSATRGPEATDDDVRGAAAAAGVDEVDGPISGGVPHDRRRARRGAVGGRAAADRDCARAARGSRGARPR